jgi:hypothetical protein
MSIAGEELAPRALLPEAPGVVAVARWGKDGSQEFACFTTPRCRPDRSQDSTPILATLVVISLQARVAAHLPSVLRLVGVQRDRSASWTPPAPRERLQPVRGRFGQRHIMPAGLIGRDDQGAAHQRCQQSALGPGPATMRGVRPDQLAT